MTMTFAVHFGLLMMLMTMLFMMLLLLLRVDSSYLPVVVLLHLFVAVAVLAGLRVHQSMEFVVVLFWLLLLLMVLLMLLLLLRVDR
jgi:hypothetical protein